MIRFLLELLARLLSPTAVLSERNDHVQDLRDVSLPLMLRRAADPTGKRLPKLPTRALRCVACGALYIPLTGADQVAALCGSSKCEDRVRAAESDRRVARFDRSRKLRGK